eukprot:15467937-Alexandrium_andersonii.AAC.1
MVDGQRTCGGRRARGRCGRKCPNPEGPGRRRIRLEAEARQALAAACRARLGRDPARQAQGEQQGHRGRRDPLATTAGRGRGRRL